MTEGGVEWNNNTMIIVSFYWNLHERSGRRSALLSEWLYFYNVLPIRNVWLDLPIMNYKAMFPLGYPIHLYADDGHPVSLPVIIGPTICKGVEYTPLFLSLREEVCALMCSSSIYPCVYLHLNTIISSSSLRQLSICSKVELAINWSRWNWAIIQPLIS